MRSYFKVYRSQMKYLKSFCKGYTHKFTAISTVTVLESITYTNPQYKEYQQKIVKNL